MRALIILAGAALALSACGKDQSAENAANTAAAATAEDIGSNDVTAIDAATGDDANMAADVNYVIEDDNSAEDGDTGTDASENDSAENSE